MISKSPSKLKLKFKSVGENKGYTIFKVFLISFPVIYLAFILFSSNNNPRWSSLQSSLSSCIKLNQQIHTPESHPTNLSHLVFSLLGSEKAWHNRKSYVESWWRPNVTRGYIFLDKPPTGADLLPWSSASPPFRVSNDLTKLVADTKPKEPINMRMVHGILETLREAEDEHGHELRWLIFGDDDTIFFVDNVVNLLSEYDHTKYYYIGAASEFVLSNYWYSFNQGFGGGGFILSYPLAKALVNDMDNCLRRYAKLKSSDIIAMSCIADIGVDLTPHQGIHQIDFRGDISGFLSAHPKVPLISLHHFDAVDSIFPSKDRYQSAHHLMEAANFDQSRILQQTICHNRRKNWSFSIAWGYTVHIYETIMPRSFLGVPIETFETWLPHKSLPHYMFNTRKNSIHPCEAPHVFFLESIETISRSSQILTVYSRVAPRALPPCLVNPSGNSSADYVSRIEVLSPVTNRIQEGRCECCDILDVENTAKVTFRECKIDEIIA